MVYRRTQAWGDLNAGRVSSSTNWSDLFPDLPNYTIKRRSLVHLQDSLSAT
jgi:hypothetical protein